MQRGHTLVSSCNNPVKSCWEQLWSSISQHIPHLWSYTALPVIVNLSQPAHPCFLRIISLPTNKSDSISLFRAWFDLAGPILFSDETSLEPIQPQHVLRGCWVHCTDTELCCLLPCRAWFDQAGPIPYSGDTTLGPIQPRHVILNHWEQHCKTCKTCQQGVKLLRTLEYGCYLAGGLFLIMDHTVRVCDR